MDHDNHPKAPLRISGEHEGRRISSRLLEEHIQKAVADGYRRIRIDSLGQHGIGGRLWRAGAETVNIEIRGHSGQRVGSMGFPNTRIEVLGPASDDVGWLNGGARIVVHGHAGNGAANAMAQGKICIAGNIGARGMTMTKHNPRFSPPELWVLGSVGDYFGEFMAGGVAVICGHQAQSPENVLGYRPLVGMVGGKVFFRGPHAGYSQADAKLISVSDRDWDWLLDNLKSFLKDIGRPELFGTFSDRGQWQLLAARKPHEKGGRRMRDMHEFYTRVWEKELGQGGVIGDLTQTDRSAIPLIPTAALRRFVPVWENKKYAAPCEASCPTGIPVQQRWELIRAGRVDEAVDLAMAYTPFPASICGYLCPHLCMQSCTRRAAALTSVDTRMIGRASLDAKLPDLPPLRGSRVAVIGGGPAGLSVAWQLRRQGHEATIYEMAREVGGKFTRVIPSSRIPPEVIARELERIKTALPTVNLQQPLTREDVDQLREDYDFVVLATGAQRPRSLPIAGVERAVSALDFLSDAKQDRAEPGNAVVVIGAGNVGCDAATEAYRLGAKAVTLIDVQKPASFGDEREAAEAAGAKFRWPVTAQEITHDAVVLSNGDTLPADTVIISIGDVPELDFIPGSVAVEHGYVVVDDNFRTSDRKIFAIGDVVRPGLLTDAIGAGRQVAQAIDDILSGKTPAIYRREMIDRSRVSLEYFDPRVTHFVDLETCGAQCSSCGACRDCHICLNVCPQGAIARSEEADGGYAYVVDENLCIGCGFCGAACPCGVWSLVENEPID